MGIVGADVEELGRLGEEFSEASTRLETLRTTVVSSVRSSGWEGPDAESFRSTWSSRDATIVAARDLLAAAAKTLARNAEDQARTSAVLFGSGTGTGTGGKSGGGGGGESWGDDASGRPSISDLTSASATGFVGVGGLGVSGTADYAAGQSADGAEAPGDEGRYLIHDDDHGIVGEHLPGTYVQGQGSVEVRDADAPAEADKGSSPLDDAVKLGGAHAGGIAGLQGSTSGQFGADDGAHGEYKADGWVGAKGDVGLGATVGAAGLAASAYASGAVGAGGSASGSVGYGALEADGKVEAFAGARAQAGAGASVGPHGVSANVGVDTFAGAEASVSGSAGLDGAQVGATATGYAGVGFSANASLDVGTDGIKGKIDFGAALGVGGKISLDVDIEPAKLADDVTHFFGF